MHYNKNIEIIIQFISKIMSMLDINSVLFLSFVVLNNSKIYFSSNKNICIPIKKLGKLLENIA